MKTKLLKKITKDCVSVLIGSFLAAWSLYSFVNPNNFVSGGVNGIATLLEAAGIVKSYISLLIMNVPLLIFGLLCLKKEFTIKTLACTFLMSWMMSRMEKYGMLKFTSDRLLASIYSGILYGVAVGIMFENNGSTGGTEIIAQIAYKIRPTVQMSKLMFAIDVVVITAGLFLFDIWSVVYAVTCSFMFERTLSFYLSKDKTARLSYVINDNPESLIDKISECFKCEGYYIRARGNYLNREKTLVKFLLPTGKTAIFKEILKENDSAAFAYVATAERVTDGENYNEKK
ncbi:MAG: YitT family protein [Clostridia bacterium]